MVGRSISRLRRLKPRISKRFEFCENGAKAFATEATKKRVTPEIMSSKSIQEWSNCSDMELDKLDTDTMLGKESGSIGSLSIGTGSGGVKMMGGADEVTSSSTTFEVSKEVPAFPAETKDKPPKFTAVEDKTPKFKPAEDKPPKFTAVEKKKPECKIAKK